MYSLERSKRWVQLRQWYTLCARTKTTNPIYVVSNLEGNNSYMMDIRAINKVATAASNSFIIGLLQKLTITNNCADWVGCITPTKNKTFYKQVRKVSEVQDM